MINADDKLKPLFGGKARVSMFDDEAGQQAHELGRSSLQLHRGRVHVPPLLFSALVGRQIHRVSARPPPTVTPPPFPRPSALRPRLPHRTLPTSSPRCARQGAPRLSAGPCRLGERAAGRRPGDLSLHQDVPDGGFPDSVGKHDSDSLIGDLLFVNKAVYGAHVLFIAAMRVPGYRDPPVASVMVFESPFWWRITATTPRRRWRSD